MHYQKSVLKFFSELANFNIIYSLGFHNLFVNIINTLETKIYQRPVAVNALEGLLILWVLTKLTWPSLVEFLYNFSSTLVVFKIIHFMFSRLLYESIIQ